MNRLRPIARICNHHLRFGNKGGGVKRDNKLGNVDDVPV